MNTLMPIAAVISFISLQYFYVWEVLCLGSNESPRVLPYARPFWEFTSVVSIMSAEYFCYGHLRLSPYVAIALILCAKVFWRWYSARQSEIKVPQSIWHNSFLWLLGGVPYLIGRLLLMGFRLNDRQLQRTQLHAGNPFSELKFSEKKMARRILDFSTVRVHEAMVPLVHVAAVSEDVHVPEAVRTVKRHAFSRIPVYHQRIDRIKAWFHTMDLFHAMYNDDDLASISRQVYWVPELASAIRVLADMQRKSINFAVVVDEYGGAVGILTLEDILEEIVGEIQDEFDKPKPFIQREGSKQFLVDAAVEMDRLQEVFKWNLVKEDFETLAGFLVKKFNRIPHAGEILQAGKYRFQIEKADLQKIERVKISW